MVVIIMNIFQLFLQAINEYYKFKNGLLQNHFGS